jgi:hypothetical protein
MREHVLGQVTYGELYSGEAAKKLPRVFFNASLLPAHSPFVFTDAFVKHYDVQRFGACKNDWSNRVTRLADVPFGSAAAASGTVPGFYYAFAETGLCTPQRSTSGASFCHSILKNGPRSHLRLADGGLYDNIGYKTAYEIMLGHRNVPARKAMILVNSGTSIDHETISPSERAKSFLTTTASNGVFAVQDATFKRLYKPMFRSVGVAEPILLDFYATAKFRPEQRDLLKDLNELAFYAAHNVRCYVGERLISVKARKTPQSPPIEDSWKVLEAKGGDCLSENFYRTGNRHKTTYKADPGMFTILWQLGRLAVRMHKDEIMAAAG